MNERYEKIAVLFAELFQAQTTQFRGETVITLAGEHIVAAMRSLHEEFKFDQLVDVTAVDYWPQESPRFHVVYHVRNLADRLIVCLRVPLDGNMPEVETVEGVFAGANWFEREVYDMFGVRFRNHSDLRRIMMPHDWTGHPLRKDYPLGYEEVQFTFNHERISAQKLHPKE